jgi:beta-glucosidase
MVERMSLVEKVGVTTGTGWQMGLCVGNTGMYEGFEPSSYSSFPL